MVGVGGERGLDTGGTGSRGKDLEDVIESVSDSGYAMCDRDARLVGRGGVDAGGHEEKFMQSSGVSLVP